MSRSARRGLVVLAITFALGALAGLGLAPLVRPRPPAPGLEALQLRPAQRARVEAIIDAHGPEVEAVLQGVAPALQEIEARVAAEIERELDPAQRDAFQRLRAEHPPLRH